MNFRNPLHFYKYMNNLLDFTPLIRWQFFLPVRWLGLLGCVGAMVLAGCATPQPPMVGDQSQLAPAQEPLRLREGDVIKVDFPGAANLTSAYKIQRDGKIKMPQVGELVAAGKTTPELEKDILEAYKDKLLTKQVLVTIEASAFSVFVTGAVVHPGEVASDRPLSCLEAVMKAGGFDVSRADLKHVSVTRSNNGKMEHYEVNLKRVLQGLDSTPFYLKPSDIVYLPEKFTWY